MRQSEPFDGHITADMLLQIFDMPVSFHRCLVPVTGGVTGPQCVLTGSQFPGCVGRIRYFNSTRRLYVPSRNARLLELGVAVPTALQLLSTWVGDGVDGELQDAHLYDFGHGPRVLAVKNTEGFAILDPDDGL